MTRSRGILPPRKYWRSEEDALLIAAYPNIRTRTIADWLMRSERQTYSRAFTLGLHKTPEFLASDQSGRLTKLTNGGERFRFQKGLVPWNKGVKGSCGTHPNSRRTQFTKGQLNGRAAQLAAPLGALRITKDGQLERKVTTVSGANNLRWKPVSRLVWEAANGPVPPKHLVRFKAGMATTVESQITIDKLELISMADNMKRNSYHNYPQPIPKLIQLKGALKRQINRRMNTNEKQT